MKKSFIKLRPDSSVRVEKIRLGRIPALVIRPVNPQPKAPGLLWIHGGGYIDGMKEMVYMSRAIDLVKNYGVVVVAPGYHLAWMKPYPAAVDECYEALKYLDAHADELGINRDKIIVGGESAGGGLAVAVCMMARDRGDGEPFYRETLDYIENLRSADVHADVDVYHTNMHAFDMMRPADELSRQAIRKFEEVFREKVLGEQSMRSYDISQEVFTCRVYPGDPAPERKVLSSIDKGDLYNLTEFSMCAHNGTHIDAPYHFIKDGKTVDAICLDAVVGKAYVADHHGTVSGDDAVEILNKAKERDPEAAKRILLKGSAWKMF